MNKNKFLTIPILTIVLSFVACVPARKYDEMENKYSSVLNQNKELKDKNMELETNFNEKEAEMAVIKKQLTALKVDTGIHGTAYRQLTKNYDQLDKTYRELLSVNDKILRGNKKEAEELMRKYQKALAEIQEKEDRLKKLELELDDKEKNLELAEENLKQREARLKELESILNRKDSLVNALKAKVSEALLGFEGQGLTVQMKNGKVYISLENALLFKSGSYSIDSKGKDAIKKLAEVLVKNPDINISVEGHTDTDKFSGRGELKDNWDLSVMRATQIVKIITEEGGVDPTRLTASGRGEHLPLDPADTKEAKMKNRRTEIILTPKLDELFQLLE